VTYILTYILLPDAGDYGGMYFFFGLIHSDLLSGIDLHISIIAFEVHFVLFILQIIYAVKIKKDQEKDN